MLTLPKMLNVSLSFRLWSHYSPNNADTISYKEFLEKLGVDCVNYRKMAPDSIKLGMVMQLATYNSYTSVCTECYLGIEPIAFTKL